MPLVGRAGQRGVLTVRTHDFEPGVCHTSFGAHETFLCIRDGGGVHTRTVGARGFDHLDQPAVPGSNLLTSPFWV